MESYLIDTGEFSQTGGRLKRIKEYVKKDKDFLMTMQMA